MKKIKLFCFPYAGASATGFFKWKKLLPAAIELVPVEMAGRGKRYADPFYASFPDAVMDMYNMVKDSLDESPYAFFGHSMGSLIAYELCHLVNKNHHQEALHLFLSGRWAPHVKRQILIDPELDEAGFKKSLLELGGTPEKMLEDEEAAAHFLAIARADFKLLESYEYLDKKQKLNSHFTLMTGIGDESVSRSDLLEWRNHTEGEFRISSFRGGHLFLNESMEAVVKHIGSTLANSNHWLDG